MEPALLRTDRLELDQPVSADIDAITEYCQDPLFEEYMTLPWPYHRGDAQYFVETFVPVGWASDAEYTWALRENGRFLGVIGYRTPTGMVGFWLGAPHRGRGFMPEALATVADWAFARGAAELRWECVLGNRSSLSVARTSGFTYTGARPATIPSRDGVRPDSWHGILGRDDDRAVKDGWP